MDRFIFYFIQFYFLFQSIDSNHNNNNNVAYNIPDPDCTGVFNLCTDADKERLGRQAIKAIHEQMDDDKDGLIEASESRDFIQEELESKTDSVRHRKFQNADLQITFDDLWTQWKNNPVYNWTNDDVVNWLVNYVHLPIYAEYFRRNQIDGRMIPRLAANEKQYLLTVMQVRDPRHKRRLIIKSTDIVLFGPPQRTHSYIKDMILISAVLISIVACLYAFLRHRKTQESMNIMLKELETLQQAEGDLVSVTGKVKAMENELQAKTKVDRGLLNAWFIEVQRSKEEADKCRKRRDTISDLDKQYQLAIQEIEQLRIALRKAEEHARHQSYDPPSELIDLLKRTYHIEELAFEIKRKQGENAMLTAKEQMGKISKMQKGFFGAVRIAHTGCMDNISELISAAKEKLAEVHEEYEEREKRWNRIASLLDRDDFINNSSIDSIPRSKTISTELINTNTTTDSFLTNRSSSNMISRALESDNGIDSSLKSRAINPIRLTNGVNPSSESLDTSRSLLFEGISNHSNENLLSDSSPQLYDRLSSTDDRQSQSSPEKIRKQLISTKIFRPFQNIRFRKKNNI